MIPNPGPLSAGDFNSYVALLIMQVNAEIAALQAQIDALKPPPPAKGKGSG